MRSQFLVISFVSALLLVACGTQPSSSGSERSKATETPSTEPADKGKPSDSTSLKPNPEQPGPKPACPADKAQAQDLAQRVAVNLLDEGKEAEAKAELLKALCMDRGNALAESLMRQITMGPEAYFAEKYGSKWFWYKVKPGDTLSKIAATHLGDPYQFYALARYNGIVVPKSLHATQVKVPGTAAAASPPPPISPAPPPSPAGPTQAERFYQGGQQALLVGEKDKAYDLFTQAAKSDPKDSRARAEAEKLKPELLALHDRKAREAFRRQDLNASIKEWDRVLELDPNNETARLERQRVEELKKRLEGVN
jgi:tetratricopeptide (TPR) repeat protein